MVKDAIKTQAVSSVLDMPYYQQKYTGILATWNLVSWHNLTFKELWQYWSGFQIILLFPLMLYT